MTKAIKEIIIMLLVCLITMLILAIALYQYIPNRKIVPEVVTYVATEQVQDLLEDDIDTRNNDDNVILTYEVTSSDLENYQDINTYVPGKANPFALASSSTSTGDDTTSADDEENSTNPNQTNETTTPNIYQNNETK